MVLLLVGLAAVLGLMRGFVVEAVSLAAWVIAIAAVKAVGEPVAAMLTGPIGTSGGATVLAVGLTFGVVFVAVRLIGRSMGKTTRASVLGPVDRLLGLGFGALKGLIVATMIFLFLTLVSDTVRARGEPRPAWMTTSQSYPLLRATSAAIVDAVERRRRSGGQ